MPKKPVTVICDLAGTFDNGWTGVQPAWTVEPEKVKCSKGKHSIVWSMTAQNVPTGFDAAFADPGVVFKPTPPWTGGTPTNELNGTVTASNDVHATSKKISFFYTTSVAVTPGPGTPYPGQTFSYDPEVENDGGGGKDGPAAKRSKTRRTAKPKAKARPKAKAKKKTRKTARKTAKKRAGRKRAGKKR